MNIVAAKVRIHLPAARSLKDKRQIVKSILGRVQDQFSVCIAEIEAQDKWQLAVLGIVAISCDGSHANEVISKAVDFIEFGHWPIEFLGYELEALSVF
jgi:uncharacterized protein YlxP (DUF503 family)